MDVKDILKINPKNLMARQEAELAWYVSIKLKGIIKKIEEGQYEDIGLKCSPASEYMGYYNRYIDFGELEIGDPEEGTDIGAVIDKLISLRDDQKSLNKEEQ